MKKHKILLIFKVIDGDEVDIYYHCKCQGFELDVNGNEIPDADNTGDLYGKLPLLCKKLVKDMRKDGTIKDVPTQVQTDTE